MATMSVEAATMSLGDIADLSHTGCQLLSEPEPRVRFTLFLSRAMPEGQRELVRRLERRARVVGQDMNR
jgi:hypothetical protein